MKNYLKYFVLLICLLIAPAVQALTFNVVVVPADLFKVCENYYCYPEVSEIVADDIISKFNKSEKIASPSLYDLRLKLAQNTEIKNKVKISLDKFNAKGSLDFAVMKQLAELFSAKSVLLISNNVSTDNSHLKRSVWEVLELSGALNLSYPFMTETSAVLLDTVNDLVMWSGGYVKNINTSEGASPAQNAAESYAKYAYFQTYSEDILSKVIAQNVILRFFPKTVNPVLNTKQDLKPSGNFFRYENSTPMLNKKDEKDEEPLEHDYGEMIYGF